MLISSGASSKVLSQIPRPQMIVDLLEQEWWAGAAAPEGTEPGNPGLDEGHVRGRLSSAGPPPPWAVLQPQEPPCPRCGPSPKPCYGLLPGNADGRGEVGRGVPSACSGAWGLRRARGLDVLMG